MASHPPENRPKVGDENHEWLLQFYHTSKASEMADSDAPEPLPELAAVPPGKYCIGDEVGSGGMKSVLCTRDCSTERNVAMAVLRDATLRSKKITRFVREARITAALEHPNIIPVYDIGVDEEGKPYFTMKLLGGETLESILQRIYAGHGDYRARYPLNRLLRIFQGVCDAIGFAHSRGVIHLDLKPANIQVGDFGEVLVLDWGLAKILNKNPVLYPNRLVLEKSLCEISQAGVSGTPGFMSPEQSRGENDTLDECTDIYALGALLHAILSCRKPPGKIDRRVPQENAKIPVALQAVAARAMSDQRENRYQSVEELAGEVRAYVDGYATEAQHAGAFTILWLLVKRHSVVPTLASVSLVTVFAILTMSDMKIRASEKSERAALQKIKEEENRTHQVGLIAAPQVLQQAVAAMHTLDYDQAITLLDRVVALDKDKVDENSTKAWCDLAAIHLGRQEFEQAGIAFSHLPKSDPPLPFSPPVDLQGILAKYDDLARKGGGDALRKADADFVHDVNEATHTAWSYRQLSIAVFFKYHNRNSKTVNFDTIEKALRWLNPR